MEKKCPFLDCKSNKGEVNHKVVKKGFYRNLAKDRKIQRYRCTRCDRNFSSQTQSPDFRHKRPDLNKTLFKLFSSGVTLRRAAKIAGCSRSTIDNKFAFLANMGLKYHNRFLDSSPSVDIVVFDEMETFIETRAKQISVPIAVCAITKKVISFNVARMPTKGPLAEVGRDKYDWTVDERGPAMKRVLLDVGAFNPNAQTEDRSNYNYLLKDFLSVGRRNE